MQGDFTRNTFDKNKHLLRVLMQQGRVQLDADWNEQASIFWHYLQTLAEDLIGSHGGVVDSFKIESLIENNQAVLYDFSVKAGHYYVNGILCENSEAINYKKQQDFVPLQQLDPSTTYLVYLDVWERHITYIEDANIREVALGGPDTATRTKVVWQVKTQKLENSTSCGDIKPSWSQLTEKWQPKNRGLLKAKAKVGETTDYSDPCIIDPTASYRGAENQLYRVEVHTVSEDGKSATFKWSRENGSVVFPIQQLSGTIVTLEDLGRDSRFSLKEGDWVEIVDDDYVLQNRAEPMLQVKKINSTDLEVTLNKASTSNVGTDPTKHPLLRRWDHRQGDPNKNYPQLSNTYYAAVIEQGKWLTLENGIQIWFEPGASYRTGDYWLIPARTATGDVEWPSSSSSPLSLPPHGVEHHYAKLAVISVGPSGQVTVVDDCRREIGKPYNYNRVINASWHHDQVFAIGNEGGAFESGEIKLEDFLLEPGLVVEFQKPVRVDSLHKRSVFVLAQKTPTEGGEATNTVFPISITPVQVLEAKPKAVKWHIGDDPPVQNNFYLITKVDSAGTGGDFTKAVKLSLASDLNKTLREVISGTSVQLSVVLRGDWILNEEVLFEVSGEGFGSPPEISTRLDKLRTHFKENGFFLSPTANLYKEERKEEKPGLWRLMDRNKMYVVREKEDKLTILATHALDGNNIWPSVPGCPSGNGTEGGDWISAIHIYPPRTDQPTPTPSAAPVPSLARTPSLTSPPTPPPTPARPPTPPPPPSPVSDS
jgi:hypothetical protein